MKTQMTSVSLKRANDVDATNAYTVTVKNLITDEVNTLDVHTNHDGKGLWINGRQTRGTGQFSAGKSAAAAYRRYFTEYHEF